MVKTLQKKFILTAMIAVTILIAAMLGAINGINIWSSSNESSHMLDVLSGNGRPQDFVPEKLGEDLEKPQEDIPDMDSLRRKKDIFDIFDHTVTEDSAMSARYFRALTDINKEIFYIDTGRIASVDEEQARELVEEVLEDTDIPVDDSIRGKKSGFRYIISPSKDGMGYSVVFLDVSNQMKNRFTVLFISVAIGLVGWILMLLLVVALSKKVIYPIAENIERQKQFITDAGHEIKTPLAIIQTNVDAMELNNGENRWSKNIRSQTERLTGLMQDMLALAHMDEEDIVLNKEDIEISDIVADYVEQFRETAKERSVNIETDIQEELCVHADEGSVLKIVNILIDNACRYCKEEGYIRVRLYKKEKRIILKVENNTDTVLSGDPEKLFDRFYRGDASRSRKTGGYGLGLAMARSAAMANGATIKADYVNTEAVVFTVVF
ncbi:MAG: HAMP domain-containing histidine kinase [Lachnospiraceae bacterium]|nr:HAMP domain-containing histidine kinase [Lachnospiraceae bacterium]